MNLLNVNDILIIEGERYLVFTSHEGYGLTSVDSENFYGDTWETLDELVDMINHRLENGYITEIEHYSIKEYELKLHKKENVKYE